jgi:hypothetical protein
MVWGVLLLLITGLVESKQEERRWTWGKTICRLEANIRQGESRQGACKGARPRMRGSLGEQCLSLPLNLLQAEKRELTLQTDRPPQLETRLRYFRQGLHS